jgi:hypothetical protein
MRLSFSLKHTALRPTALQRRSAAVAGAVLLAAFLPAAPAQAQLGDLIKQGSNALGGVGNANTANNANNANNAGSGLGGLGSLGGALGGKSVASGSMGNVAGLLEFCIKNYYLGGGAGSVKDRLMSKLGGGQAAKSDNDYQAGGMGLLKGADGKQIDLSGGGLKEKITRQVCDKVLSQGKSFL